MPARLRRSRQFSVRSLLAVMLVLPAACLLVLWAVAAWVTVPQAAAARDFRSAEALYAGPARGLASALAAERLQAVTWLTGRQQAALATLRARFRTTDAAAAAFLAAVGSSPAAIPVSAGPALAAAQSALARRAGVRASVVAGRLTPLAAAQAYSTILTAEFGLDARVIAAGGSSLYRQAAAVVAGARAAELVNGEVALARTAGPDGAMSPQAREQFAADAAGQRVLTAGAISQLDAGLATGYRQVAGSAAYRALTAAENQVIAGGSSQGVPAAAAHVLRGEAAAERQALARLSALTRQASNRWLVAAALAGGLGLIVVLALIALMVACWSRLGRGLTTLQRAAAELADDRLARLAEEVAHGANVTAAATVPAEPPVRGVREIAATGEALAGVWHAAVRAAAEQVRHRTGASALVHTAARRSQALLQRQHALLGTLQLSATEPANRAALAAAAALSTQMQRHASGLLVLAGDPPGQVGRGPLAIAEVLHAAAAEVGEGPAAIVVTGSDATVDGTAAADVVHLVAELAEFAASRTPPGGQLTLRAARVGRGLAVEVEDGGRGFSESELEAANAALASSGTEIPADSQLSLYVAGRLAARHKITVTLQPSPAGGTVAVALLPHAVLLTSTGPDTVVAGSLSPIDPGVPGAESASPVAGTPADESAVRVPAAVSADDKKPDETSPAPWSWLTASPAPREVADPPASEPGTVQSPEDPPVAAPLPKRVRQASLAAPRRPPGAADVGSLVGGDATDEPPGHAGV